METVLKGISFFSILTEHVGKDGLESLHLFYLHVHRSLYIKLHSITYSFPLIPNFLTYLHSKSMQMIEESYVEKYDFLETIVLYLNSEHEKLEEFMNDSSLPIMDAFFRVDTRKTIREVVTFIRKHTRLLLDVSLLDQYHCILKLTEMQKFDRSHNWKVPTLKASALIPNTVEMAELSRFAAGIYGHMLGQFVLKDNIFALFSKDTDKDVFIKYSGISPSDVLLYFHNSQRYLPVHAVVLHKQKKALLIVIRGTKDPFDVLADLESNYTNFTCKGITGELHTGIYRSAVNLSEALKPKIFEFFAEFSEFIDLSPQGCPLIILGHSLGAGCAALLRLLWMNDCDFENYNIKTYAYAPPSVLSADLNQVIRNEVISCVNGNDIVPRLSFGTILDLAIMVKNLYVIGLNCEKNVYRHLRKGCNTHKIVPPGSVLQIYAKDLHSDAELIRGKFDDHEISASFVENEFYQQIILDKNVVTDHFMTSYQKHLEHLAENIKKIR